MSLRQLLSRWLLLLLGVASANIYADETTVEASRRLSQVSAEIASTIKLVRDTGGTLGFWKPAAPWCTEFLRDLLTLTGIKTLSAQYLPQANRADHRPNAPDDPPLPTLDPKFQVVMVNGTRLIHGYITVSWRGKLLVLLVKGSCTGGSARARAECRIALHSLSVAQATKTVYAFENSQCSMTEMSTYAASFWKHDFVQIPFSAVEPISK